MKKLYSLTTILILSVSLNFNTIMANELLMPNPESCFSFYHGLFNEFYGGVNLGNVGDFNDLVGNCQATFG
jgi:hypothetical protein